MGTKTPQGTETWAAIKAAKTVKSKMDYKRSVLLQIGLITDIERLFHLSWFLFLCTQCWNSSRAEGPGIILKCLGLSWWGKLVKQGFKSSSGYCSRDRLTPWGHWSVPSPWGKGSQGVPWEADQVSGWCEAQDLYELIIMTLRRLRPALPAESTKRHKPKHGKKQSSQ